MAFVNGSQCSVLVAQYDLSSYFSHADVNSTVHALDATTFKKSRKVYIPGLVDGKADLMGLWDSVPDAYLNTYLQSAGEVVTIGPNGLVVGAVAKLLKSRQMDYKVSVPVGGLVSAKVSMQADGGLESGYSLQDLLAQTITGNGTSVDNGAATTNGFVAHLHVSAYSGFTNVIFTVEDSADNSSFATIGTFTTVTAVGSERIEVAGNVRRYVRVVRTKTGAGSVTFQSSIARR